MTVSTRRKSTPPSIRPSACVVYADTSCENVIFLYPGSFTFGEIEQLRLVGPILPATKRGLSSDVHLSATSRANNAAAWFT